jgi:hypothetical protein
MIKTVDVVASAAVSSIEFGVTYAETRRSYSGSPGYAKVKGVTDQPDEIELDDRVTVSINEQQIFEGKLKKATQNKEGIITIEAYDALFDLKNQLVRLNTEEPRRSTLVLRDLFTDAGYSVVDDLDNAQPGSVYIAPGDEFAGGDPKGQHQYGSARAGDPLSSVVDEIAKRLGAVYWIDKNDVIRIEPFPEDASQYDPQYILDVNAGEDTEDKKRVLVKGGSATSEFGLAASHAYSKFSPSSEARFDDDEDTDESKTKTIQDNNIITKKELDSRAVSGALDEGRTQDAGTVTISGNTAVEVFDTVRVPQLTYNLTGNDDFQNVLGSGRYTVRQVTHLVDAQDGYQTELNLSPEHGSLASLISSDLADQLAGIMEARMSDEAELLAGPTNESQT